ncbi:hypothetical protein GGR21_002533 [Dysgonomonas hofstadii]|uniref:IraD/Gp25-like domain-containing protein n=1 Tax=Dysgonomonas hofstadii TaxID=637886 RepID=A0A840CKN8_9BACT|nr:GPW/gp25 family protein [Dysgonomonas hofstadii]MBB4036627.1 hypothetical protein [Dysgonomonas hofstadii]
MNDNESYIGKGWTFPPRFIKGYGASMVSLEEDIKESLQILLGTTPGERIFRYDYGCSIRQWAFEEINLSTKTLIIDSIRQAIISFETRIDVENIHLGTTDISEGILWINIDYKVRQTNNRSNKVYPFYFKEGTNL